jgi:hypothetical protein
VDTNVSLLKRFNWLEQCLVDLVVTQLNAVPEWEVKGGLALHIHQDAEHALWIQGRVAELRHPPHKFHIAPDDALDAFTQEVLRSQGTIEVLTAIVRVIRPALLKACRHHLDTTNPLVDQPTCRRLRFIILDEEQQLKWGEAALDALLVDDESRQTSTSWESHLNAYLAAAGGITGDDLESNDIAGDTIAGVAQKATGELPAPRASTPLVPDFTPNRDSRIESNNYNFPPHWVYAQRDRPLSERTLALVCKRLLEMDVPEMMAAIIWRAKNEALAQGTPKTWDYTVDMTRQMWDEARHSMMGESWLVAHGINWTNIPLNTGFSEGLNLFATAKEAHAALYAIEQGLMPQNSGKAYEWRVARDSGDAQAMLFMDYDWADEVLHVHIGRHLVAQYGSRREAEQAGNDAFARLMALRAERTEALAAADASSQRDWWSPFVDSVLGYTPAPLDQQDKAEIAPWKKKLMEKE